MGQTKETFYFPCIISLFHNPVFINCAWERDPLGTDFLTRMRRATQNYTMLKRRCAGAHLRPVTSLTSRYGVRDMSPTPDIDKYNYNNNNNSNNNYYHY